jgi:uncharacterized membrane protein
MAAARRLDSLDALRGAIMIIMALDHIRDFFHSSAMLFNPTDLQRTTAILFFTRWITHFCAPVFFFTAGAGAFLWQQRGRSRADLSRFLVSRGLWLILLEATILRIAYQPAIGPKYPVFLVILWALGCSMIALALLAWMPVRALAAFSVTMILVHNAFDRVQAGALWNVFHRPTAIRLGSWTLIAGYPLIPWIGVMAAGYCFGRVLLFDPPRRRRITAMIGGVATLAFPILRAVNVYGDPAPWTSGLLSFLNVTKYPPSLDFLLMTLGPALLALAWLDGREFSSRNPLIVFGRVPLFYFVLHFSIAHLIAIGMAFLRYGAAASRFAFQPFPSTGGPRELFPPGFGYDLWVTYAMWALIVVIAYPLCRWYAQYKATHRSWWLSYL